VAANDSQLFPARCKPATAALPRCIQALGCPLLCWDVGGAPGLRGIWTKYYGECHALVFVVDAADNRRFDEAKAALDRALGMPALQMLQYQQQLLQQRTNMHELLWQQFFTLVVWFARVCD
jgi:hypothetical protein